MHKKYQPAVRTLSREIIGGVLICLTLVAHGWAVPNIVYILADDLGWTDLGCQGSKYYETPNIDALASSGMRFLQYHNCQNCQPTRAALMTGQYGPRTGVYTVGSIDRFNWRSRPLRPVDNVVELPLEKVTIAQVLQKAGYRTGIFGKWHLGSEGQYHPSQRGFDEAIVSMGRHFDFRTQPPVDVPQGQYLADFLTDKAIDFIHRSKDRPFFLYLPHFGVHAPHDAKPQLVSRFQDKPAVGGHDNPVYAAMIASVDESVGRIIATLDSLQIANNTIVIFSSDNGGVGGYGREGLATDGITDNAPLRSGKGSLYEGGIRDPFIVKWPGHVPPNSTCDQPTIHVDLFPTLADLAAAKLPEDHLLDGESLVPLFRNSGASLKRDAIYQHFPGIWVLEERLADYARRLDPIRRLEIDGVFRRWPLELYNLREDIGETTNLVSKEPDRVASMHAKMKAWRSAIKAPMPTPNRN